VISPNAVQEFVEKAQATDKQLRLWEGLRHETLNERLPERIDVAQSIAEWIEARSKTV
jgi:alpha-beta hydrolase superfamily lysophospholipase